MTMKKQVAAILAALMLATVLLSCGPADSGQKADRQYDPGGCRRYVDQDIPIYNYDMFAGVRYEVNIANPAGSRIENLTWPDGEPVKDEDEFEIAVNNYRATTQLLEPGTIYEEDELPELVEMDVHGEKGGVREMIRDYIVTEKGGVIGPECDENWRITGIGQE